MPVPKGTRIGGRQKGTPNKSTRCVKELAGEYGKDAIERLAHLMKNAESEQAQVSAAKELLDRAYGKSPQAIVGDANADPIQMRNRIEFVVVDPKDDGSKG